MKVKETKYTIILNTISVIALIGVLLYLLINWSTFPERIPGHYNFAGQVDRWGSKRELLFLPITSWVIFIVITLLEQFPQLWNTGVEVTKENKSRIYAILKNMIVTIKCLISIIFSYMTINDSLARQLPTWFTFVYLGSIFGSIGYYLILLIKAK